VLCCEHGDLAGLAAILARTKHPHDSLGMMAALAAGILDRAGWHGADAEEALREVAAATGVTLNSVRADDHSPARSFEVTRDASALVRCCIAGDGQGVMAVLNGTPAPHQVAAVLAAACVTIGRRAGLTDAAITAELAQIRTAADDAVLDQPRPKRGHGRR
jgi:hypothetical protein